MSGFAVGRVEQDLDMWLAVSTGQVGQVRQLIEAGKPLLHIAASSGQDEIVELLLGAGAEPEGDGLEREQNQKEMGWRGDSPLFVAVTNGHDGIVTQLLESGADINQTDGRDSGLLYAASWVGNVSTAAILIAAGADVERSDMNGWTPLYCAAKNNKGV